MQSESDAFEMAPTPPSPANSSAARAPAGARNIVRFLYNHNPFYVISAALVLYGLRVSFLTGDAFQTRALIVGLMIYVLLLAGTAWLIIRLGSVWNDARTILLIIVLLFVAISVACDLSLANFDSGNARDWRLAVENVAGSYSFALAVSEGLLLGLGIRLRFWYRLSYHLFLALFFLYPLTTLPLLLDSWNRALPWALFGYSLAASLAVLALWPAVRRGAAYVERNGTPWRWPLFPWSLFVILAVASGLRHYYLCLSFYTVPGLASLFRPYFLVPPLLAVNLLLIEAALRSGRLSTRIAALAMPPLLIALAGWHPAITFWQREFLSQFRVLLPGEPMFVTLGASILLYLLAAVRRLPGAFDCLAFAVAALAVLHPVPHWNDLARPDALPLAACAMLVFLPALRRRSSPRVFFASCLLLAALTIVNRQTWIVEGDGLVPGHLLLALVLLVGSLPNDRFAKAIQELGVLMLVFATVAWWSSLAEVEKTHGGLSARFLLAAAYPLAMALLGTLYGRYTRNRRYFAAVAIELLAWSGVVGPRLYLFARQLLAGFDYLFLGALSFLLAAATSLFKTGWPQRRRARRRAA